MIVERGECANPHAPGSLPHAIAVASAHCARLAGRKLVGLETAAQVHGEVILRFKIRMTGDTKEKLWLQTYQPSFPNLFSMTWLNFP
jgi:hypothetical protein